MDVELEVTESAIDKIFSVIQSEDMIPEPVSYTHLTLPTSDLV